MVPKPYNKFSPSRLLRSVLLFLLPIAFCAGIPEAQASGVAQVAQIADYLLGKTSDATQLDANGDSIIDIADIIYAFAHQAPSITSFTIANGADATGSRAVSLNNTCSETPAYYMASESASFSDTSWQTYSAAPAFTLSPGNVTKTVYFKVKNADGQESPVVSDTITLIEITTLTVGATAVTGDISPAEDVDWYQFTVSNTSTYAVETWSGSLADNVMELLGPNSVDTLIATDDNSGNDDAAKIALTLSAGTYYVRITAATTNLTGDYTINVTNIGVIKVNSLKIDNGASLATSRTVALDNTCAGSPTHFMASESSSFSGASWMPYDLSPSFTLSSGNATKKVYFKIKDLSGTESAVVNDTITLTEMTALPSDGSIVSGNISTKNEEDWYVLTIETSGPYTIQTYEGSLMDTTLGLADMLDPDDDEWIAENDNIDDDSNLMSQVTWWLDAGTYYIRIMSADTSTGDYTIRAWKPDTLLLSVNGSTRTGDISSSTDVDWYRVKITTAGVYSILSEEDDEEDDEDDRLAYGIMELYDDSFNKIALDGDGTGPKDNDLPGITASLSEGTYIIRMAGESSDDTGSYTIKAFSGSISGGVVSLMLNGPTTGGAITSSSDVDWYQFIVNEEDKYTFKTTDGSLERGFLTLRDEDMTILEYSRTSVVGATMPKIEDVDLDEGVYYLGFNGYDSADRGTYKIQVYD